MTLVFCLSDVPSVESKSSIQFNPSSYCFKEFCFSFSIFFIHVPYVLVLFVEMEGTGLDERE